MEIRQLKYFVKIADLQSFSRASIALHVAQPALSHQMASLEAELGQELLVRRHNGTFVNEKGRAFYEHAQRILKELDDLPNVVNNSASRMRGAVAVGLPQSTAVRYAMPLIAAVDKLYPGIQLEIFDELSGNLLRGIDSGRLNIAVVVSDQDALLVKSIPLMEEELFFITANTQPEIASFPLSDLANERLALPSIDHGVRALLEGAIRAYGGLLPPPAIVANSINIMRTAVASGAYSSVMPWGAVYEQVRNGTLRAVPFEPRLSRRVHLCWSRNMELSPAARAVKDLLIEHTHEQARSGEWLGVQVI